MNDKSPLDDTWQDIAKDWQAQPFEKVDIGKLTKKLKSRTRTAKLILLFDILATISLFIATLVGINQAWNTPTVMYLAFGAVFSTVYVYFEIKLRRLTWQMAEGGPEQAIERHISGLKGSIDFCQLSKYSCYVIFIAVNVYIYALTKTDSNIMWFGFLLSNSMVVLMFCLTHLVEQKRRSELKELNKVSKVK